MRTRILALLATVVAVLALTPTAAQAAWYWYMPSHPMRADPMQLHCTGGWAIRGDSGMFFLTAGHCFEFADTVSGTSTRFGWVRRDEFPGTWSNGMMDALLVQPDYDVDALQQVPGFGQATGKYSNAFLSQAGHPIGMLGQATGWTTGVTVAGWWTRQGYDGEQILCATYHRAGGDSGAPVFTHDGNGHVTVAGIHVGWVANPSGGREYGCYIPIDSLLARFGAWLPVFSSAAATRSALLGPSTDLATAVPTRTAPGGTDDGSSRVR